MERRWWTLLVVCAATFMLLLDIPIVTVALPEIQRELHGSFGDVQWVIDAYALTLASALLTAGALADRYGRRRLFSAGLVVFTLGSLLCGVAQSPLMLNLSRAFQGIGGAILFATALALLAQTFHGKDRGVAFGVWGAVSGIATSLGPILGGLITSGVSWRGIFLVNLPIGVAALAVTAWRVDESRAPRTFPLDWAGFVSLTLALVSLVYGLIRAGESSWTDHGVLVCLCLAAVFLTVFVVVEVRAARQPDTAPMFDLSLFKVPTFLGGSVAAFCMNGSMFAMFLYLVLYLQDNLGYSALQTGLRLLLIGGASLLTATLAGRASSHLSVRWLIGPGLLLVGIGLLLMAGLHGTSTWTHFIPGFIIAGLGIGAVNPPLASAAVGVVPPWKAGIASGANTTFRQVGIATSIAALGTIFTATLRHNLDHTLAPIPGLSSRGSSIAAAIQEGNTATAFKHTPPALRAHLADAIHASFASSLNDMLITTTAIALARALASLALIRTKDFIAAHQPTQPRDPAQMSPTAPR